MRELLLENQAKRLELLELRVLWIKLDSIAFKHVIGIMTFVVLVDLLRYFGG